jgi:nucleoside 2-deoxyribosyltransferase
MKIYIAGPYSKGDVAENVRTAIHAGDYCAHFGHTPFIPHLTHFWHFLIHHEYEFWMQQDEAWLRECDAVLRLAGESAGADREVEIAKSLNMPIFYSVFEIPRE